MKRRHFLGAALAAFLPAFMREAFAMGVNDPAALRAAAEAARAEGLPLLVIVSDVGGGGPWGELLTYGDDAVMARLGQCAWICGSRASVKAAFGLDRRAWMWVIPPVEGAAPRWGELDMPGLRAVADALEGALAAAPPCAADALEKGGWLLERTQDIEEWNEVEATVGFLPSLAQGAAELRASWGCAGRRPTAPLDALDRAIGQAEARVRREPIAAMSAMIERTVGAVTGPLPEDRSALVKRAVFALRVHPPPNARWGMSGECGATYEPAPGFSSERGEVIECGAGNVSPRGRRFLDFLVTAEPTALGFDGGD